MEQIKSEIINTALKEGEALPSVRSLAGELRISALTVKKAYDKLEEEGFVTTIHGKGTYVTASDKQLALEARQREAEADFEKAIDRAPVSYTHLYWNRSSCAFRPQEMISSRNRRDVSSAR